MAILESIENDQLRFSHSLSVEEVGDFQIHCHDIYEVYYFVQGDVDYMVEGNKYQPKPHSLLLLSPYVFHGFRANSPVSYERYSVHFSPNLLSIERRPLLLSAFSGQELHSQKEVYYQDTSDFHLDSFFRFLSTVSRHPKPLLDQLSPIYVETLLAQLTIMCQTLKPTQVEETVTHTITEIIHYLNLNLKEPISLDQLSERFFISKHYLNRAFRKATGATVGEYLTYKRATYAKQLLLNGYSAGEAALESGFSEYSTFYRVYVKIHGHAPAADMKA